MPLASPETSEQTRLAITEQDDRELAAEILEAYRAADELASQSCSLAKRALQMARRCGAMLNAKKQSLPRGRWLAWLSCYLPEISQRTVYRWTALASKESPVLEEAQSLKQAYIAVGMLPDPIEHQRIRQQTTAGGRRSYLRPDKDFVVLLHELYRAKPVESMVQLDDFSDWPTIDLEILELELSPLVELHKRIKSTLGRSGEDPAPRA